MTLQPNEQVLELRRYTLHPGQRDVLVALFDAEFIEPQEAAGMRVVGQFIDVDDAQRFVWLRAFADMPARQQALQAFYGGPVWAAHRDAANATMVDSDDVHLLRPAWPGACRALAGSGRAARGATPLPPGAASALLFALQQPAGPGLLAALREWAAADAPGSVAWLCTEPAANNFPRLPVHADAPVLLRVALHADLAALDAEAPRRAHLATMLQPWLAGSPVLHRLRPTARSALHA